jgi:thiamine pyrophosphokinase
MNRCWQVHCAADPGSDLNVQEGPAPYFRLYFNMLIGFLDSSSPAILADIWREKESTLFKVCKEEADAEACREIMARLAIEDDVREYLEEEFVSGEKMS